ncbi:hypothetical protein GCM10008023_36140 [Sphingomonas glacialis]|uniref:DUF2840 domain-containing protein n=1 Tax=Sphingomonas glacialis TaxID=658225 RepID=A0ABQ3LS16_9SPHN|nr:DUF2840 domain-containing protein [Sphingomonas glacialis]GHH24212.1 hypothetical protein GCM10008023_36140 [Sphingomonas glacialis]
MSKLSAPRRIPDPPAVPPPSRCRTYAELHWIEGEIEHWIRFGAEVENVIVSRRTRIVGFDAGTLFALVRWSSNDYGTTASRIDIVRAPTADEGYTTLPFVRPGGDSLLSVRGWPKVQIVLRAIDAIEALSIDPGEVAPDYWRHLHNRIAAGQSPRDYSRARHSVWLLRRRLLS